MKIGILTWYKVLNHGAVLQAYALQSYLQSLGHEVVLLKYNRPIPVNSHLLHRVSCIPNKIKRLFNGTESCFRAFVKDKQLLFSLFRKQYIIEGEYYNKDNSLDLVFIGSDQVFDILSGYNPYMFGQDVKAERICAYAPCAAQTTYSVICKSKYATEISLNLKRFTHLSARDSNTKELIHSYKPEVNIPIVLDPVLLYGFSHELDQWKSDNFLFGKKYIAVYAYQTYLDSKKEIDPIIKFARENKYLIVAVGYYHSWCDISINASPTDFLYIINNAVKVVTDTFHGTVFALTFNTDFCTIVRPSSAGNSNKLGFLVSQFNLENNVAKSKYDIYDILNTSVDWITVNKLIDTYRKDSQEYILQCLTDDNK